MKNTTLLSALISFLFFYSCAVVSLTGRRQLQLIPRSQMLELSNQAYNEYVAEHQVITGTEEALMVQRVGTNIRSAVESYFQEQNNDDIIGDFQWEFTLFQDTTINAWAMPRGKVGINSGILPLAQDDAGLAVIIGHEIGHVVAEHGNERMSQLLLVELGGIALSEALSEQPEITRQLALVAFGVGAQLGVLLPYSRLHETEADRLGLIFMAIAGYDPREAISFWERMVELRMAPEPPEFLSTHPSDETRVENIRQMIPEAMEYYQ
ncbi:M48 family metallopeptidase [Chitinispirillales bacterium ANBcel5]|uniref:M48 family metallopeptidase n=1 Tax=Cellulosispirillum alkaliphilum TaxID=3039283 RepID=UPI002A4FC380|nr:M48 family metallopeptidase [Chitinispirillales bacterium ANBcel5]